MDKMHNTDFLHQHITLVITKIFNGNFDYFDASSVLKGIDTPDSLPKAYIDGLINILAHNKKLSHYRIKMVEKHCANYL